MSSWHAELLQQQAELEALKARLSQQQQQQEQARAVSGASTSRSSPAVAHSRTLLLAPFLPSVGGGGDVSAAGDGSRGVGSPAGPVMSSSSPLTYQQRRAAAQQAAAAAAGAAAGSSTPSSAAAGAVVEGLGLSSRAVYSQQSQGATAAEQQLQPGRPAVNTSTAAAAGYELPRWRSSSTSPDGLENSLLFGSPQAFPHASGGVGGGGAAGGQQSGSSWGLSLTAAAAVAAAKPQAAASNLSTAAAASPVTAGQPDTAVGLSKLGDDVLGALSLSRYHRERSKLQEARAKQHALLASHHEDQAAALRNSRLGAQSPAAAGRGSGGSVLAAAPTPGGGYTRQGSAPPVWPRGAGGDSSYGSGGNLPGSS